MTERKGPITVIQSISDERNRWKALAFAWKASAMNAVSPCAECGTPALWWRPHDGTYWCATHCNSGSGDLEKVPWHDELLRALELEEEA